MTLSYLVSTAGHAQHQNDTHPHDVQSILQLIVDGAKEFEDEKVVGFTREDKGSWVCDRYSYVELLSLATAMEDMLRRSGIPRAQEGVVSLLCPTGLDFLVSWIALMRMGYGVVFTAPQCSPSAVAHLANSSTSAYIIYHLKYQELAAAARPLSSQIPLVELPPLPTVSPSHPLPPAPEVSLPHAGSVSHIFHTSGTSGTPKPIPHTHYGSVAPLPRRALPSYLHDYASGSDMAPSGSAAFTTTPLFHGGVSDLLRAWMARSMIYFYPTSDTAITVSNVVKAVEGCNGPPPPLSAKRGMGKISEDQLEERDWRFKATAFLSVPYILTILAEDEDGPGMEMLRKMELVSTGGAPLDSAVGDRMVQRGVRLVSRLGSSECGFLLSSHRDYHTEMDWEWLRNDSRYADALVFEPVGDGRYEMVVSDQWRSKAGWSLIFRRIELTPQTKSNREDGSYATGDLYERHERKPGVWRYAGRGDDVLVMSNGEKASPGPIELAFRSSPLIADVLVVGAQRSQLGLLLFPRQTAYPISPTLLRDLAPQFKRANDASPTYAQVSTEMCAIIDISSGKELPKSSKGTIQRGVANEVFKEEIQALYGGGEEQGGPDLPKRSVGEIAEEVERIIVGVVQSKLKVEGLRMGTDLFSWGVDSLMATRIRNAMLKSLNIGTGKLSTNVVFERPTITLLAQHVHDLQEGRTTSSDPASDASQLMRDLADKYGSFSKSAVRPVEREKRNEGRTILLTGATGSLGSYLLQELLASNPDDRVMCLVRAGNNETAERRVRAAMSSRGLSYNPDRTEMYGSNLALEDLGLGKELWYGSIVKRVDIVIHAAWPVHFSSSLISFEDNIKGTRNLIDLIAQTSSAKLYFCSSLASVLSGSSSGPITEDRTDDPSTASGIGYSQSKWTTEQVCLRANEALSGTGTEKEGRVGILRVGQLCGDKQSGRWNEKEGWPLMIRTAEEVGCLPLLDENPTWLPVDIAAKAIIDIIATPISPSLPIYHIVHPTPFAWTSMLDHLEAAGLEFARVPPAEWVERMDRSEEDLEKNPSRGMLEMWRGAYGPNSIKTDDRAIETRRAQTASPSLRQVEPIGEELVKTMVAAWRESGFLKKRKSSVEE